MRFFFFWGAAGLCEIPFILAFAQNPIFLMTRTSLSLWAHLAASVLIFFCVPRGPGWLDRDRLFGRNFSFLVGVFSIFGWVACGLLYLGRLKSSYTSLASVEAEMDFSFVPSQVIAARKESRQERVLKEMDVIPLTEILAGSDFDLKRGAIARLAQIRTPETIALLQSYRSDVSPDLRFFVTTALTQIKRTFEEELQAAKNELQKDSYKLSSRIYLARVYLAYARSYLLEEMTAEAYVEGALHHLQFSIMDEDAPPDVFWLLIEIYRERKDWENMIKVLDVLENRKITIPGTATEKRAEALFYLGRFDQLKLFLKKSKVEKGLTPHFKAQADWWGSA